MGMVGERKITSEPNIIDNLKAENADLKAKLCAALDVQMAAAIARRKAERKADKWRQAFRGAVAHGGNVVAIRK